MGKSFRHNDFTGRAGDSEKRDKQMYNRKMRRENKRRAQRGMEDYLDVCDVANPGGKVRFDGNKHPKLRRK
jgi:hypothetical protein